MFFFVIQEKIYILAKKKQTGYLIFFKEMGYVIVERLETMWHHLYGTQSNVYKQTLTSY